jgi:hypothetical protein
MAKEHHKEILPSTYTKKPAAFLIKAFTSHVNKIS